MRINKIDIFSFGGLKNVSLDFTSGFNVIYGKNENGKTTVMSFIKMMFYGNERGSAVISKNPRKKYAPWDGSTMAGCIEFEHAGKNYRLEREFRSSNSTDKTAIIDLDLGTRQTVSGDIGITFFGLSPAAFDRSVFIGQFGFPEKDASAEGEINSKLSNIVSTGDESTSYETVNSRLQKAKLSLMSKSGRVGEFDKNLQLLQNMEERLQKAASAQEDIMSLKSQIDRIKESVEKSQQKAEALKSKINTEQDFRNAEKLKEMLAYKEQLDSLNEKLKLSDGKLVDEVFVRKVIFCISKIDALNEKINSKAEETKALEESIELAVNPTSDITPEKAEQLKNKIAGLTNEKAAVKEKNSAVKDEYTACLNESESIKNSKKPINLPVFITAIMFLCISAVLFISALPLFGGISGGIAAIALILSFVIRPKDNRKIAKYQSLLLDLKTKQTELASKESEITQQITSLSEQLETVTNALNSNAAIIESQKKRLEDCKTQLQSDNNELCTETNSLISLFSRYKPVQSTDEIKSLLDDISAKANKQKELKQQLNYIIKDVGNISYDEAKKKIEQARLADIGNADDFDTLKQEYERVLSNISDEKSVLSANLVRLKTEIETSENPESVKSQIEKLKDKIASQKEYCQTVDIAMQILSDSFAELRRSYGSVLEKKSGEIFKGLTENNYNNMSISKSFEINVEKNGVFGGKSIDYLSSGTADQAYLSLRLALSSLITETSGESLPILLDDALSQYDDDRIKAALEFLNKYSDSEQIIMFTCHNSIFELSKSVGAECKRL